MRLINLFILIFIFVVFSNFVFATEYVIASPDLNKQLNQTTLDAASIKSDLSILSQKLDAMQEKTSNCIVQNDIEAIKGDFFAESRIYLKDLQIKLLLMALVFYVFVCCSLFLMKSKRWF